MQARGRQYLSSEIDEEGLPKRMLERTVGDVYSIDRDLSMQSIWKYRSAREDDLLLPPPVPPYLHSLHLTFLLPSLPPHLPCF